MEHAQRATSLLAQVVAGDANISLTPAGPSLEWEDKNLDDIAVQKIPKLDDAILAELFDYMVGELLSPIPVDLPETVLVLAAHLTSPLYGPNQKAVHMFSTALMTDQSAATLKSVVDKILLQFKAAVYGVPSGAVPAQLTSQYREKLRQHYSSKSTVLTTAMLDAYFAWYDSAKVQDRVEYGCYTAFCALRAVSAQELTVVRNLGVEAASTATSQATGTPSSAGFYSRFRDLYKGRNGPSGGIQGVAQGAITQIKNAFSTGSIMLCSILVPVLKRFITEPAIPQEDMAILKYGLLMTLEYTGIYLADSYVRAVARTGENGTTLIPKLYWHVHHDEYARLLKLVQDYMKNPAGKKAWRWAKCLHSDYLTDYSGAANPWLCSLFTALFAEKEPQPEGTNVWEKFCLKKAAEHKDWATKLASAYWSERYTGTAIPEDSELVRRIVGMKSAQTEVKTIAQAVPADRVDFEAVTFQ